jgi:hypothetical protein
LGGQQQKVNLKNGNFTPIRDFQLAPVFSINNLPGLTGSWVLALNVVLSIKPVFERAR